MQSSMQTPQKWTSESLALMACQTFLDAMPENIRSALQASAAEMEYPIEAVLESAIAASLDPEALSFADCKLNRSRDLNDSEYPAALWQSYQVRN